MRIASVEIHNFRCLQDAEIAFDDITTFIGPNGCGKSTVLAALDWFFNGDKNDLRDNDVYAGASTEDRSIQVRVIFDRLTDADREQLGPKYAPAGVTTFTVWRTWDAGVDKITGKALAFPPFESVRAAEGAKAKKLALEDARSANPDLALPSWSTLAGVDQAMDAWEREHPDHLVEARVSASHFFGFYGQGKLSGLFDYVLVAADLRAAEESVDGRETIIGRILEKAIDRTAAAAELAELVQAFGATHAEINARHLTGQLEDLAADLTAEVEAFTVGRKVQLRPLPLDLKPQTPRVDVAILDAAVETIVARQGHGFQRALLVAALKLLARRGASAGQPGTTCLAIEEPELYQHPTQARALASVLRALAEDSASGMQVAYATHSPYFIEPRYFDQIRRVTRRPVPGSYPRVRVTHASVESVCKRLEGYEAELSVKSRWDQICLRHLPEAFFADGVILVEGDGDKAILEGATGTLNSLAVAGVAVAAAGGKTKMLIPHAILAELDINTLLIFDNDSGCRIRMERQQKDEVDIELAEFTIRDQNHKILKYFDLPERDYPVGILSTRVVAIDDTIEAMLTRDWPEWEKTRSELVSQGRGVDGKNAATYWLAAHECPLPPSGHFAELLGAVLAL